MKNVLVVVSKGFEEVELLGPLDMFSRVGINYDISTIDDEINVVSSHGFVLNNCKRLKEIGSISMYDMLLIPGGGHYKTLSESKEVFDIINKFDKENKLLAFICAAPLLLGHLGLLKNKNYTMFTSMNEDMGGNYKEDGVVVDGRIITGKSVYYSIPFGIELVNQLLSKEETNTLKERIYAEK